MKINLIIKAYLLLLYPLLLVGQTKSVDNGILEKSTNSITSLYYQELGLNASIYNGYAFENYKPDIKGLAYFKTDSLVLGTINYDGFLYHNVPLMLDLYANKLITPYFKNPFYISLINELVGDFNIGIDEFINIKPQDNIEGGFFKILLRHKNLILLSKTEKQLVETVTNKLEKEFIDKTYYYLNLKEKYYQIENLKSLYNLFPNQKTELKQFFKREKLSFKRNPEQLLTSFLQYQAKLN